MFFPSFLTALLGVVAFHHDARVLASLTTKGGRSPYYQGLDPCPARCSDAGPRSGNWSLYHNVDQFRQCSQTLFLDFSLYDDVDDAATNHRVYACSVWGADWTQTTNTSAAVQVDHVVNSTYQMGWWPATVTGARASGGPSQSAIAAVRSLSRQMRWYLTSGHAQTSRPVYLFGQLSNTAVGLYMGRALQNEGTGDAALSAFEESLLAVDALAASGGLAMQLCDEGSDADHIFGVVATTNGTFSATQKALASLSRAECLSGFAAGGANLTAQAYFVDSSQQQQVTTTSTNTTTTSSTYTYSASRLSRRASPNADGSCATYTVNTGDTCSGLAGDFSLTIAEIEAYNAGTWAWNGCGDLGLGSIICVSTGDPPMPAVVADAVCGPQVPGTERPTDGTALADLNPCALKACCDVWGHCGTTDEFCTNTSTSAAPGTAAPGTNGCISNCGTDIVFSGAPSEFRSVTYFNGGEFGSRSCLFTDARQIDGDRYTHLHYAFATLSDDYEVLIGDDMAMYEFENFRSVQGPKKIITFGGWDFSTGPSTYYIFRNGVTAANRLTMATNIANFVKQHGLDGVDIDWEYPGEPDIGGIPAASEDDGVNYFAFLVVLRNLLGSDKSISIAAPSSYWYLKGYTELVNMSDLLDYIIFMTYDLHGQWDYANAFANPGCPTGNCLRSQVNLTETINSLSMVTKAGVPSNKIVVGVTSYGRSFHMAAAGCYTENCLFTGSSTVSDAAEGPCTATAGYISDAEIKDIIADGSRVNYNLVDDSSSSNILVYDDVQWVAWMDEDTKAARKLLYQLLQMGGSTDWAVDLEDYQDPPGGTASWSGFMLQIKSGVDPWEEGSRTGNWTEQDCTGQGAADIHALTAQQRWDMLDCAHAWQDALDVWTQIDRPANNLTFSESIANTYHVGENAGCANLLAEDNCDSIVVCTQAVGAGSGPAGYVLWNSLVMVHEAYKNFHAALYEAAATALFPGFQAYENAFTPLPDTSDGKVLQVMLDLIGLLGAVGGAVYFNDFLETLPSFLATLSKDTAKDGTLALIAVGTSIAKDLVDGGGSDSTWTAAGQADFAAYMGQAIYAWGNVTEQAVAHLFGGTDDAIDQLTKLIEGGRFIEGSANGHAAPAGGDTPSPAPSTDAGLQAEVVTAFWSYTIPVGWTLSGTHAFVLDSGFDCSSTTGNPLDKYLSDDTASATRSCYEDKLYYLVAAKGDAELCINDGCADSFFQTPSGLGDLDGKAYGGLTLDTLVEGSVKTYQNNNGNNGGSPADFSDGKTLDALYNADITTAGYIRIPVCTAETAYYNWDSVIKLNGSLAGAPSFPCNTPQGEAYCGASSFTDQTSGASPTTADCRQVVANIALGGDWTVDSSGVQHQLVQYGGCAFGIQGQGSPVGNVDFTIGNQDIIDIITTSINMFGGSGQVGAKGTMSCSGNAASQNVLWGIY